MRQYKMCFLKGVFFFLLIFIFSPYLHAEQPPMKLWYTCPARHWMTSALPIGNGALGGLFFGGIECERLQFNEKTLWTGSNTIRGAYQSFGDLYIDFAEHDGEATNYHRELCLDDAIGMVTYDEWSKVSAGIFRQLSGWRDSNTAYYAGSKRAFGTFNSSGRFSYRGIIVCKQ